MPKTFTNIEAFYADNEERRRSGEADYGVWWTEANRNWPRWRVSYIQKTGEVYAVQLTGDQVKLLGFVPPDDARIYYQTIDRILEGWADVIHEPNSLDWVRARLLKCEECKSSEVKKPHPKGGQAAYLLKHPELLKKL